MKKPIPARSTSPITPATTPPIMGPDECASEDDVLVWDTDPSEVMEGAEPDVADEETLVLEMIDVAAAEDDDEAIYLLVSY